MLSIMMLIPHYYYAMLTEAPLVVSVALARV